MDGETETQVVRFHGLRFGVNNYSREDGEGGKWNCN